MHGAVATSGDAVSILNCIFRLTWQGKLVMHSSWYQKRGTIMIWTALEGHMGMNQCQSVIEHSGTGISPQKGQKTWRRATKIRNLSNRDRREDEPFWPKSAWYGVTDCHQCSEFGRPFQSCSAFGRILPLYGHKRSSIGSHTMQEPVIWAAPM